MQRNFFHTLQNREYNAKPVSRYFTDHVEQEAEALIAQIPAGLDNARETGQEPPDEAACSIFLAFYKKLAELALCGSQTAYKMLIKYIYSPNIPAYAATFFLKTLKKLANYKQDTNAYYKLYDIYAEPNDSWASNLPKYPCNFPRALEYLRKGAAVPSSRGARCAYSLVFLYGCELQLYPEWNWYYRYGHMSQHFRRFYQKAESLFQCGLLTTEKFITILTGYASEGSLEAIQLLITFYRDGSETYQIDADKEKQNYWVKQLTNTPEQLKQKCLTYIEKAIALSLKYGIDVVYKDDRVTISIFSLFKMYCSVNKIQSFEDQRAYIRQWLIKCENYFNEGYPDSYLMLSAFYLSGHAATGFLPNPEIAIAYLDKLILLKKTPVSGCAAFLYYMHMEKNCVSLPEEKLRLLKIATEFGHCKAPILLAKEAVSTFLNLEEADRWLEAFEKNKEASRTVCASPYYNLAESLLPLRETIDPIILDHHYIKWHAKALLHGESLSREILADTANKIDDTLDEPECANLIDRLSVFQKMSLRHQLRNPEIKQLLFELTEKVSAYHRVNNVSQNRPG